MNTVSSNVFGELYELKDFKAFDTINWALAKVSQKENEWIQVKDKYVRESAGEGVLIYVLDDGYTSHTKGPVRILSRLYNGLGYFSYMYRNSKAVLSSVRGPPTHH